MSFKWQSSKERGLQARDSPEWCTTERSTPGSSRQKVRADATLGGTLSAGSHTGAFLRKAEAEISGWPLIFQRQLLETYPQKQNTGKGEKKAREELWELQIRFMLFSLWQNLNQCSNHHLCPSSLDFLAICLLLYSNPQWEPWQCRDERGQCTPASVGTREEEVQGPGRWWQRQYDCLRHWCVSSDVLFQ